MPLRNPLKSLAFVLATLTALPAAALELGLVDSRPLRLDVTAATVSAWHADNRNKSLTDDNYVELDNRFNLLFAWWRLQGTLRLDTASFGNRPDPAALAARTGMSADMFATQVASSYQDAFWIGKASLAYSSPSLELTAGDSYASFGRGLVLSLRKQDELALDTTLFGAKAVARFGPVSVIGLAGIANPVRIDEATGQTLFPMASSLYSRRPISAFIDWPLYSVQSPDAPRPERVVYGQDDLYAARAEANLSGFTLGAHAARLLRANDIAPSAGLRSGHTVDGYGASLNAPLGPAVAYLEGALQRVSGPKPSDPVASKGYALYGSFSGGAGPVTGLVELQHYRSFVPLFGSIDTAAVPSFLGLRYSAPPTTEPSITDTRFGYFDACVTGGRARLDGRPADPLLLYATYGHWATWGERDTACPETLSSVVHRNDVNDATAGMQLDFDQRKSQALFSLGIRRDLTAELGEFYYREFHLEATLAKHLSGPWSAELTGRQRHRFLVNENNDDDGLSHPFNEGEIYLSLKYSPSLVAALGYEYTGLQGRAPNYFNGQLLYKYRADSSVKLFAGQQRGALKCVSGVCRNFPPFEGVKLEWTQRY